MSNNINTLSKGEQFILDQGLYVAEPICFMRLFTQSERDVLNAIRHSKNCKQTHISLDALVDTTGMCKNTVRAAIATLSQDRFLKTPENPTNKDGTDYRIQYGKINNIIKCLNEIKDPKERAEKAKELRQNL